MNSKKIGNIGESVVISEFVKLGLPVYIPFGDNEKADLIAEFNGKLNKIQVKTSTTYKDGKIIFSICSSTVHRQNGKKFEYTKNDIDYFALYNIEKDVTLLIKVDEVGKGSVAFRDTKPKNNQTIGIKFIKDYILKNNIPHKL